MDTTLHTVDGTPVLRFERRLPHPVAKVWRAITDPEELAGWFPWHVEIDLRTGGTIAFTHPSGAVTAPDAVITELDEPRVFAYRWNGEDLRWQLSADGGACVLVFTHAFAERPAAAKFAAGWHLSLDALGAVLDDTPVVTTGWAGYNRRYVREFGLLDGEIDGRELRVVQELAQPTAVVWQALVAGVPTGVEADADGEKSLTYPWVESGTEVGTVRFALVPQNFGARVELTVTADTPDRLPAARSAWRDRLLAFADELDARGE